MRLEWLEDILAVAETGSFGEAAERRGLTQSAFSRRIQLIEEKIGVELFDRTRKPVDLRPTTAAQRDTMVRLAGELRALQRDLRDGAESTGRRVTIASQHALTATRTTSLIEAIHRSDARVRVELVSDNLDACFAKLLARRADIAIVYREPGGEHPVRPDFVEVTVLGGDRLIPVIDSSAVPQGAAGFSRWDFPYVAYPAEVFFGQVLSRAAFGQEGRGGRPAPFAETALSIAALEIARAGVAVAWVPWSLAAAHITGGQLRDLSGQLPSAPLETTAVRLRGDTHAVAELCWRALREAVVD